jgi:hypothetical protein
MKNIKYILIIALYVTLFSACKKDEVGGTATQKTAGEWVVTADYVKVDGSLAIDPYQLGYFHIITYNTVKNVPTEMWVDDNGNFWEFKVVVDLDYNTATFSTNDYVENNYYDSNVKITDGKVLYGAAKTPSGMPADSIVFYASFDDDDPGVTYKISGYRYTGLANDEQ